MPFDYTTTELIASIRRRASLPTSQNLFSTAEILQVADEELLSKLVPAIVKTKEDYFVKEVDSTIVVGTAEYRLPIRAVGGHVRQVALVDSDGNEFPLPRVDFESLSLGQPAGVLFRGNVARLVPVPANSGLSLRVRAERRPNHLTTSALGAVVTAINRTTGVITFTTVPASFATSMRYDFQSGQPPFDSLGDDRAISARVTGAAGTMTFAPADIPADLVVGDYVAEQYFCSIPQLPYEGHAVVAQMAAAKLITYMSDKSGLESALSVAEDLKTDFISMLTPRSDGNPKKIVSREGIMDETFPNWAV